MTNSAEIIAWRNAERDQRIISAMEECERTIAYRIDVLLDTLCWDKVAPRGFDGSKARTELCDRLAHQAITALIMEPGFGFPDEAQWLWIDRFADGR